MMARRWLQGCLGVAGCLALSLPVKAQVVPDATLGNEASQISPNELIRGAVGERIVGGAQRGSNLFHSFQQFNVNDGQRVYFANPAGVQSILTRVTGNTVSNILGTLGVDGNANLFLINPNGILFGPNARLDITGSLVASTASSFQFPDGSEFSATNPQAAPLLTVNVRPGLQYGANHTATITNRGNLAVGQDLTLAAGNLDLQGQLQTGGDLTLRALDTVQIRDTVTTPFVAAAAGKLVVQGDRTVDIFALNHPNSGLFAGGDLVLRSANTVSGDAHYWSGGNFRIEQLDGTPGNLFSPYDPVILAFGDVELASYEGASLHILAGGNVTIRGDVTITGPDFTGNALSFLAGDRLAFFSLSDDPPGIIRVINGIEESTLDIRAGIDWNLLGGFPGSSPGTTISGVPLIPLPSFANLPSGSNITITGRIFVGTPVLAGGVLLTNQYFPNANILNGSITVDGAIFSYGDVYIDSRNQITTGAPPFGSVFGGIDTSFPFGESGDIKLIANGNIDTTRGAVNSRVGIGNGIFSTEFILQNGIAGDITFISRNGNIQTADLLSGVQNGFAGNITLAAAGNITTGVFDSQNNIATRGAIISAVTDRGISGSISFTSLLGGIDTRGGVVNSSALEGIGGNITFNAFGDIITGFDPSDDIPSVGSYIGVTPTGERGSGQSGNITFLSRAGNIDTRRGSIDSRGGQDSRNIILIGRSGNIEILAAGDVLLGDVGAISDRANDAGNIGIGAFGSVILDQSDVSTTNNGAGLAGNIVITANQRVEISNSRISSEGREGKIFIGSSPFPVFSSLIPESIIISASTIETDNLAQDSTVPDLQPLAAGSIAITANQLIALINGTKISSSSSRFGNAGGVILGTEAGTVFLDNSQVFSTVETGGLGGAGAIVVGTGSLIMTNRSQLQTLLRGSKNINNAAVGQAGFVFVQALDTVTLTGGSGIFSIIGLNAFGGFKPASFDGINGAIVIQTGNLFLADGSELNASNFGTGDAGVVGIFARGQIALRGSKIESLTGKDATGNAGGIYIEGESLSLLGEAQLNTNTLGTGNAGAIAVLATGNVALSDESSIASGVGNGATGQGGGIFVQARSLSLSNGAQLNTSTLGFGDAGVILILVGDTVSLTNGSRIVSGVDVTAQGQGGGIFLEARSLSLSNGAQLNTSTLGFGNAGDILVFMNGDVSLNNNSFIASGVGSTATGQGGRIDVRSRSLSLSNGAQLSTSTFGIGNAGDIQVFTNEDVSLRNNSAIASIVGSTATGQGGRIDIRSRSLSLFNGAQLNASTFGVGNAGDIFVFIDENVSLRNNSAIVSGVSSTATGQGGRIDIRSRSFLAEERSGLTTETLGQGDAGLISVVVDNDVILRNRSGMFSTAESSGSAGGDIDVKARSIRLENQSGFSTQTRSGQGGDITLNFRDWLLMRNGSGIITSAGTAQAGGDGGNITINNHPGYQGFILAVLSENSDISANAFTGRGGNIRIRSNGIYGILPQTRLTPFSDITASSALGIDGEITLDTLNVDPSRGLVQLPTLVDPSSQIDQRCNPTAQQRNSFTITGRGGLASNPIDPLKSESVTVDLVKLPDIDTINQQDHPSKPPHILSADTHGVSPLPTPHSSIIEAQTWIIDPNGNIVLLAESTTTIPQLFPLPVPDCILPQASSLIRTSHTDLQPASVSSRLFRPHHHREVNL